LFIDVIYIVFFHKLHQQHEASIKDNHLQRSRSSSEHRKKRELMLTEFNLQWKLHMYIITDWNSLLTRLHFHL